MREILFRGKRIDTEEWVEGFYCHIPCGRLLCEEHCIQTIKEDGMIGQLYDVYETTLGQFTGLIDMTGRKIFEGDIVESYDMFGRLDACGTVQWSDLFLAWHMSHCTAMYGRTMATYKVIGNVHDNLEHIPVKTRRLLMLNNLEGMNDESNE